MTINEQLGRIGFPTRVFVDGRQIGTDSTYMDYYPDLATAIAETRSFYLGEGYSVDSIAVEMLSRWPVTPPMPTLVVRLGVEK
jgi:hypothetical protein